MKKLLAIVVALGAPCFVSSGFAIDRDAGMIDVIGADVGGYRDVGYFGGSLWVENRLAAKSEDWALVAGIGGGEYDIKNGSDPYCWFAGIGIKRYLAGFSSLTVMGSYRNFENESNFDIVAGTATFKLRFVPSRHSISPYVAASGSLQYCDFQAGYFTETDETFNALVLTAGVGIDFMASEDFAFVFEAGLSDSQDFNDGVQYADGFYGGIYMRHYWQ
ncbi:MAG: hypothetical protein QME60_02240 [Verrucomicrobiota bacterium]|nr:hypothetical protein [Verrucomicrobiota bacterium]